MLTYIIEENTLALAGGRVAEDAARISYARRRTASDTRGRVVFHNVDTPPIQPASHVGISPRQ